VLLVVINIIFVVDIELTLSRNKPFNSTTEMMSGVSARSSLYFFSFSLYEMLGMHSETFKRQGTAFRSDSCRYFGTRLQQPQLSRDLEPW
jgi:hypothetical protein